MLETASPIASYGSWRSPITASEITARSISIGDVVLAGEDVYWSELRPQEQGRTVVVRRTPEGQTVDLTPPPFSGRSRVHEYGGAAFTVQDGVLYFVHALDQRLYRQRPGKQPEPLTPAEKFRFADGVVNSRRQRWIGVREDHRQCRAQDHAQEHPQNHSHPVNDLVAVALDGSGGIQVLATGHDFYATPRLSPDGCFLAWLTWDHPQLPWDGTELWVAAIGADGHLETPHRVAGGPQESIFQPEWSPDGVLHFVGDRTGWWNLYRWQSDEVHALCPKEAEFGRPQWVFGMTTYGFMDSHRILCTYTQEGLWLLAQLHTQTGVLEPISLPYTDIGGLWVQGDRAILKAGSPTEVCVLLQLDLATGDLDILRRSTDLVVDGRYVSVPEAIAFPTRDGATAYGFFYPPMNPDFVAPPGEKPPLLVRSHGGPTAATSSALDLRKVQYWTSRGIAVLDVNYRGSTGYGRAYRQQLQGQWGLADGEDCIHGAQYLVQQGRVDGDRLIISGSSAGGYTTLCVLTFWDVFKVGASYYGISDLEALLRDTHKFEARYFDGLIGPYPDCQAIYQRRSPIHFSDQLNCPVIFFQGLEDRVVPPNQSATLVNALKKKGLPVAYVTFEGEQHGFRQAETLRQCLEAELFFYSTVLGFPLADPVPTVPIYQYSPDSVDNH